MAIELISKIKPKNSGSFAMVDAEDVEVVITTNQNYDFTYQAGNLQRYSYHIGDRISLGEYTGYRINKVGIRASAGAAVRFALYSAEQVDEEKGIMTQITVLGEAVADGETHVATLTFAEPYEVRMDNTIILAFANEAVLHCFVLGSGLVASGVTQFEDANYFVSENGTQIGYYNGETQEASGIFFAMCARDIDLFKEQRLDQYVKDTDARFERVIYPVVEGGSDQTLVPEQHYVFGSVKELTVKLEQKNDGKAHEYWFEFEPTEDFAGLTISPAVRWMAEPQYPAGKKCIVGIVRGMAVMGCG